MEKLSIKLICYVRGANLLYPKTYLTVYGANRRNLADLLARKAGIQIFISSSICFCLTAFSPFDKTSKEILEAPDSIFTHQEDT